MHPLDGPKSKVFRAAEHIQTFDNAVSEWYDSKPLRVVAQHFNTENTAYVYRIEVPAVPIYFGIVAGDIFHNLRSALDHIVWQLALKNTSDPGNKTAFPICVRNNKDTRLHIDSLLKHVSDDARQVIESLQPYNASNGNPESHGLWILDRLSNFDKHRMITLNAGLTQINFKAGMSQDWFDDETMEITVPVVYKNFPPPPPEMKYYLTLGAGIIAGGLKITAIPIFHKLVANTIIPRFEHFFP